MLSKVLQHYKRKEVQEQIVLAAPGKEAVGSYGGKGYARRPDVIIYPNDVLELVKNGITSFHISEETWSNPQGISTNMKKNEYDSLRVGWDLVLDIDCPYWEFAKITTWLFVKALKDHGIKSVTVKFSGNKGFHIGVPFEAFPENFKGEPTKNLFPEGPRKIAAYLLNHITEKLSKIDGDDIVFGDEYRYKLESILEKTGENTDKLLRRFCQACGRTISAENKKKVQFSCTKCALVMDGEIDETYKICSDCGSIMQRTMMISSKRCCNNPDPSTTFNFLSIVEVDTVLIASRHLYRAPYSYHEKSGLVSLPIDTNHILDFERSSADPASIEVGKYPFLHRGSADREEGTRLLVEAMDYVARKEYASQMLDEIDARERREAKEFEEVQTAIPEKFFPPCIKAISSGLKDGRKRAVFMLINFLSSCGWEYDDIEVWFKKWNEKNLEPLRDQYFLGQLRYAKQHKKKVLPPNCDNQGYYKSFGVCKPDNFCKFIKNPVNYAIKRARLAQKQDNKSKKPKKDSKIENKDQKTS